MFAPHLSRTLPVTLALAAATAAAAPLPLAAQTTRTTLGFLTPACAEESDHVTVSAPYRESGFTIESASPLGS